MQEVCLAPGFKGLSPSLTHGTFGVPERQCGIETMR